MTALRNELAKLRGKRLWLTVVLLVGFELLWEMAILMVSLARDAAALHQMGFVIGQVSQVHAIFAPILAAVVVSRLAAMEHDSNMMPALFAANQSRGSLFGAKFILAFAISTAMTVVVVAVVTALATSQGIAPAPKLTGVWLVGLILANIAVVAIQLVFALLFHRQSVTLVIGVVGGLMGSFAGFVPPVIAAAIPWQYAGLVTPVRMAQVDGAITGFPPLDDLGAFIMIVAIVGVLCTVVGQVVFSRRVSR